MFVKTVSAEFYALIGAGFLVIYFDLRDWCRQATNSWGFVLMTGWRVAFGGCLLGALWTPRVDVRIFTSLIAAWAVGSTIAWQIRALQKKSSSVFSMALAIV